MWCHVNLCWLGLHTHTHTQYSLVVSHISIEQHWPLLNAAIFLNVWSVSVWCSLSQHFVRRMWKQRLKENLLFIFPCPVSLVLSKQWRIKRLTSHAMFSVRLIIAIRVGFNEPHLRLFSSHQTAFTGINFWWPLALLSSKVMVVQEHEVVYFSAGAQEELRTFSDGSLGIQLQSIGRLNV